jgi:hypothetical protein
VRAARAAALLAVLAAGSLAGCAKGSTAITAAPLCHDGAEGAGDGVILMAQSVPTATQVPCIRTALPLGWTFHHLIARNGGSQFWLDSDRDGQLAIEVRLTPSCDVDGSTEIPTDREGLRRLEGVRQTTPVYVGERYYLFPGGCLTFAFHLGGDTPAEGLALATQSIGVVSRDQLRAQVRKGSDGRLSLDPTTGGDG